MSPPSRSQRAAIAILLAGFIGAIFATTADAQGFGDARAFPGGPHWHAGWDRGRPARMDRRRFVNCFYAGCHRWQPNHWAGWRGDPRADRRRVTDCIGAPCRSWQPDPRGERRRPPYRPLEAHNNGPTPGWDGGAKPMAPSGGGSDAKKPAPAAAVDPMYVYVSFQPAATGIDIAEFVKNYDVAVSDGPDKDGVYKLRLDKALSDEDLDKMIESMRGQKKVVQAADKGQYNKFARASTPPAGASAPPTKDRAPPAPKTPANGKPADDPTGYHY